MKEATQSRFLFKHTAAGYADRYYFWCPGCKTQHWILLGGQGWELVSWEPLVIRPSVRVSYMEKTECHLFIVGDKLQFLNDCIHSLAGQTVPMENPRLVE